MIYVKVRINVDSCFIQQKNICTNALERFAKNIYILIKYNSCAIAIIHV
jgi:hypothetical protein